MIDLKSIRKSLKKTQAEMADFLNLGQSAYSKLERGEWNMSPKKESEIETTIRRIKPTFSIEDYRHDSRVNVVYGVSGKVGKVEKFTIKSQDSPLYDIIDRQELQISMQNKQIETLLEALKAQSAMFSSLIEKLNK